MAVEEWDRRQLCSDGGCTGLINASGVCGTCGRAAQNWGDERKRGLRNPTDAPPVRPATDDDDIAPSAPAALGAMADWGTRRLCSDGGCIGVIGTNNKCRTCGKPGPAASGELERVAAEMAGTATAGDLASIDEVSDETGDEDEDDEGDDDADEDDDEDEGDEDDEDDTDSEPDEDGAMSASASTGRDLCPDGACVGVIGANGRCKVCDKPSDWQEPS